jgi:hypothetical protein
VIFGSIISNISSEWGEDDKEQRTELFTDHSFFLVDG